MRTATTLIIALVAALGLAACNLDEVADPATTAAPTTEATTTTTAPTTTTVTVPPAPDATVARDELSPELVDLAYEITIGNQAPHLLDHFGFDGAKALAVEACNQIDNGDTVLVVSLGLVQYLETEGFPPEDAGAILGAGLTGYCPEHVEEMERMFDAVNGLSE